MAFKNPWQDDNDPWGKSGDMSSDFLKNIGEKLSQFFSKNRIQAPQSNNNKLIYVILGGAVALYLTSGFYQVQHDEKGVVLRFGKWSRTVDSGLHYALPYPFETVLLPRVTKVNRTDIRASGNASENGLMLTGDLNLAEMTFSVLWKIKESDVKDYLFCDRNPELTVKAVAESIMREIVGQTAFSYLQTEGRGEIQNKARENLQAVVDEYDMGIDIIRVELRQVEPPVSVIDSFRDVERAQAEQQSEMNKADAYARDVKARTRGLIAERINKGESEKREIVAKAQGTAARFLSAYEQYKLSPDIVSKRMYMSVLKDVYGSVKKLVVDDKLKIMSYVPLANDFVSAKSRAAQTEGNNESK